MLFSEDEINNPHAYSPLVPDGLEQNAYAHTVAAVAHSLQQLSSEDHQTRSSAALSIVNEVLGDMGGTDTDRSVEIALFMAGVIGQMTSTLNHQWPDKGSELLSACCEVHLSGLSEPQPYWGSPCVGPSEN